MRVFQRRLWLCVGIVLVQTLHAFAEPPSVLPMSGEGGIISKALSLDRRQNVIASRDADGGEASGGEQKKDTEREWGWRKAGLAEYAGIALLSAGALLSESNKPREPKWTAHNGFDEKIRNALHIKGAPAEGVVRAIGDISMDVLIAEPVVDSFVTLGYRDRRWEALWQTSVVNVESFVFTGFVSSVLENTLGREKPYVRECPERSCARVRAYQSMPSGHVAFVFTGAGLYCTHHAYQSLYDPATERAICASSLGVATVTGLSRIMVDSHYATDVIAGSAIGLFSGFLLPRLLHYWWVDADPEQESRKSSRQTSSMKRITLLPQISSDGGGLSCEISF